MKNFFPLVVILLFLSCEKSNDSHDFISAVESELGGNSYTFSLRR